MPSLVLVDERVLGKSLCLERREYLIGRGSDCDLVLDGKEISRKHARVRFDGSGYVLEELKSKNGTRVNGRPITSHVLKHGDEIAIGDFTIVFDDGRGIDGVSEETHVRKVGEETKSIVAHAESLSGEVSGREGARKLGKFVRKVLKDRRGLKGLANQDRLTGMSNRLFFDKAIADRMAEAKRTKTPLSLLFVDLDHFKNVNDTYGHDKGDEVLKAVAKLIRDACRRDDVVARYGGEEFVVLFAKTSTANAVTAAESIRSIVEQRSHELFGLRITASFGIATYPDHASDEATLIRKADQAVYEAKAAGRNRVILSHG